VFCAGAGGNGQGGEGDVEEGRGRGFGGRDMAEVLEVVGEGAVVVVIHMCDDARFGGSIFVCHSGGICWVVGRRAGGVVVEVRLFNWSVVLLW